MIYNTMNMIHSLKLQWIIFLIVIMYYKCYVTYVTLLKANKDHL